MRLCPSEQQKVLLERHFGSCRFVWNHFLDVRTKHYAEHRSDGKKGLNGFDTMRMPTLLKKEITWFNEINSQSLKHPLLNSIRHSSHFSSTTSNIRNSGQERMIGISSSHPASGQ